MVYRNSPADCLRPPLADTLPTQCQQLKRGYGECKKGMIDMRKRFRGNKPISTSLELEGEGSEREVRREAPMLYAGKGSFEGVEPRRTDGREMDEAEMERKGFEKFVRNDGSVDWRKK